MMANKNDKISWPLSGARYIISSLYCEIYYCSHKNPTTCMATEPQKDIPIKASEDVLGGVYANVARVSHAREEFVLDFLTVFPPQGKLNARVILSPGHAKRLVRAMQENLAQYEQQFGEVKESDEPRTRFGFPIE